MSQDVNPIGDSLFYILKLQGTNIPERTKPMKHNTNPVFPKNFFWGASSAAWQVEGATLEGGRTQSIIDLNSQTKKPFTDNSIAADHYHHYKEDVALMKECGFTSYRFSLSWSRIIPDADRKVNPEGIRRMAQP